MKKQLALILAGAVCLSALAGCGAKPADGAGAADKTIVVGATPTPHAEILSAAKDELAKAGYTLDIREFTDYVLPNTALSDGDLDANFFQHTPYLNSFNAERGTKLAVAAEMHYEPFGIYPGKTQALADIKDGAIISVPNDDSNETRALLLLQDQGLIQLKDGIDPTMSATVLDIAENPRNFEIKELAAEQLTRSLQDVDIAVINGNFALQAGLNANDNAIATEKEEYGAVYVNVLAVRDGEQTSEKTKALVAALQSDAVRTYIADTYKGAVVPVF